MTTVRGRGLKDAPAIAVLAVTGCYAAPPLPVDPSMLPACSAGSYGVLGTDVCERDDGCAVCTSVDGHARAMSLGRYEALGGACTPIDMSARVACCEHRCTLVASGAMF